jgi:hypothetical protein
VGGRAFLFSPKKAAGLLALVRPFALFKGGKNGREGMSAYIDMLREKTANLQLQVAAVEHKKRARGRPFVKGGPPGPGRPKGSVGWYKRLIIEAVQQILGPDEIQNVVCQLYAKAQTVNCERAAELLLKLGLGLPSLPEPAEEQGALGHDQRVSGPALPDGRATGEALPHNPQLVQGPVDAGLRRGTGERPNR